MNKENDPTWHRPWLDWDIDRRPNPPFPYRAPVNALDLHICRDLLEISICSTSTDFKWRVCSVKSMIDTWARNRDVDEQEALVGLMYLASIGRLVVRLPKEGSDESNSPGN